MKKLMNFFKLSLFIAVFLNGYYYSANAQSFEWIKKSNMVYKCAALASCELEGKIYAIGGTNGVIHNNEYGDAYLQIYDIVQNKWSLGPLMKYPRMMLGVTQVEGKIYAIGGGWSPYLSKKIEVYDPVLKTWTDKAERPKASSAFGTCAINNKIYTFGGTSTDGKFPGYIYNTATDSWEVMTEISVPVAGLASVYTNGKIYAMGGVNKDFNTIKTVQVYDVSTDKWEKKSDMPYARFGASAVVNDNKIYVFGGAVFPANTATNNIQIYDIATDSWTENTLLPVSTQWSSAVKCSSNNKVYLMGGEDKCMMTYTNAVMLNTLHELELKPSGIFESNTQTFSFNIYPDPASNEISIELNTDNILFDNVEIHHLNGAKINNIISWENYSGKKIIRCNVENLPAGIYLCTLNIGEKQLVKRFIKQ